MPLFKGQGCKAKPAKAINYITNPQKAAIITSHALDDTRDYAKQFSETCALFGKAKSYKSRKYYHFKHSFDPKDNITPKEAHRLTDELAKKVFEDYEYIIATHTDKAHIHCHIIINSVSFVTGKMLHLNNREYGALKDLSNEIAEKYGYSTLDFRKPSKDNISSKEKQITLKGGTSWKEELREVIAEALLKCNNMSDFEKHLNNYGITITRNTEKTISFKHPNKQKAIRGEKLGSDYTKESILIELNKQRNRTASTSTRTTKTTESDEQTRVGKQFIEGSVSRVHREVEQLAERAKQLYTNTNKNNGNTERNNFGSGKSERANEQGNKKRNKQTYRSI